MYICKTCLEEFDPYEVMNTEYCSAACLKVGTESGDSVDHTPHGYVHHVADSQPPNLSGPHGD